MSGGAIPEADLDRQCLAVVAVLARLADGLASHREPAALIDLDYERVVEQPYRAAKRASRGAA